MYSPSRILAASLALSPCLLASAAQSTVLSYFLFEQSGGYSASVVTADSTATVYQLNCSGITSDPVCYNPLATITVGPSIYTYTYSMIEPMIASSPVISGVGSCNITGTTRAVCSDTLTQIGVTRIASRTYTDDITLQPITVTAGLDKLPGLPTQTRSPANTSEPLSGKETPAASTSTSQPSAGTGLINLAPGIWQLAALVLFSAL